MEARSECCHKTLLADASYCDGCPVDCVTPTAEANTDAMRWNDRLMEVLTAIHGPVDARVNDSVRLAFAQTLSEFIACGVKEGGNG